MVENKTVGIGTAHSKIILMGEHVVVYDYPAIALPFPTIGVTVTVRKTNGIAPIIKSKYYTGRLDRIPSHMTNLKKAIEVTLASFNLPHEPIEINIESQIPAGRGMGSSAAVAVALVRAIMDFYNQPITDYQLHLIVNQAEVIAHEKTSGLDTLIASSQQPFIYRKSRKPTPFDLSLDAYLVLADSGQQGQTKQAVHQVAKLYERKPEFIGEVMASIGRFVEQAYEAIQSNDITTLGRLMTYNHYYLNQLEVSNPVLDEIVNASWLAGALGAKLTGAGLGGCVIALAETHADAQRIAEAVQHAGAKQTWLLHLKDTKNKVQSENHWRNFHEQ